MWYMWIPVVYPENHLISFHYNPTHSGSLRMNSLYDWEAHGTCRTTQTWPTKTWSGPWTKMSSTVGKTTTHASLPLLILGPTMLCCLAKILPIAKGETFQAYYGPASGFLLGQYVNGKVFMLNYWVHWGDQQHHVQMFTVNDLIFISDIILF